jgi:hypothetical protein
MCHRCGAGAGGGGSGDLLSVESGRGASECWLAFPAEARECNSIIINFNDAEVSVLYRHKPEDSLLSCIVSYRPNLSHKRIKPC